MLKVTVPIPTCVPLDLPDLVLVAFAEDLLNVEQR